jgi:hypothetical protein
LLILSPFIAGVGLRLSGFIVKPYTRMNISAGRIVSVKDLETSF